MSDITSHHHDAKSGQDSENVAPTAGGAQHFTIEGASCASCVTKIESAIKQVPGVTGAEMNFAQGTVTISGTANGAAIIGAVEAALIGHGIRGFTVHSVRGLGADFYAYNRDPLTAHIRLMTYTSEKNARAVAQVIMDAAHAGIDNEGLVQITPIDKAYWIHTRQCCDDSDFDFHEVCND